MIEGKEICGKCGKKMAVWLYMPGYGNGSNPYSCDDCISSVDDVGCSCNWRYCRVDAYTPPLDSPDMPEGIEGVDWRWVTFVGDEYMKSITREDNVWQHIDERGRPYPCAEYDYDPEGFDVEEESSI